MTIFYFICIRKLKFHFDPLQWILFAISFALYFWISVMWRTLGVIA